MPNFTPNFELPYPSGTDAPCDFDEQWCEFTDAVNAVLGTFTTGADRAIPVVPAALVRSHVSRQVFPGQPIAWDHVVLDTAAMVDMDADPYHITIRRPGRYSIVSTISKLTSGLINTSMALFLVDTLGPPPGQEPLDAAWSYLDRGAGVDYLMTAYTPVVSLQAGTRLSVMFSSAGAALETVSFGFFGAFWHSDNEAAT